MSQSVGLCWFEIKMIRYQLMANTYLGRPFHWFLFFSEKKNNAVQEKFSMGGTNLYDNFIYLLVPGQKKRHAMKVINLTVQNAICSNFYANLSYIFPKLRSFIQTNCTLTLSNCKFARISSDFFILYEAKLEYCFRSDRSHRIKLELRSAAK